MIYFFVCDRLNGGSITTLRPLSHFASKHKEPYSIDCRERRFHARGVYLTQDTTRMRVSRVKQEEEAETRIIAREL